jgi:hypothetical protein
MWQAPAQNRRRETAVVVSDMAIFVVRGSRCQVGKIKAKRKSLGFSALITSRQSLRITDSARERVIS